MGTNYERKYQVVFKTDSELNRVEHRLEVLTQLCRDALKMPWPTEKARELFALLADEVVALRDTLRRRRWWTVERRPD